MYQLLIHSLVLTTMLYATPFCRSAEAIYNPPDLTKPVFDIDKIGLTEAEQKAIATVLTEFVRNGNTMAHDHLDFCSRALAIALRLDPTNKSAVVADAQLREGQQPKFKNVSVTNADFAAQLFNHARKINKARGDDNLLLAGYLLSLASEIDPANEDTVFALAIRRKKGRKHDWGLMVRERTKAKLQAAAGRITAVNPDFANKDGRFQKRQGTISGLFVMTTHAGIQAGEASEIIATVLAHHVRNEIEYGFVRPVGEEMYTSMLEAFRAVQLRYPHMEGGKSLQISFADKYSEKDGGSAGTAFAILMLSLLDGFDIDQDFAVTGDITVNWKTRVVGAISSKIRGASLDDYKYVIVPADNAPQVFEIPLLDSTKAVWKIQIFGPPTLDDAIALVRTDRPPDLQEAMDTFAKVQAYLVKNPNAYRTNKKIQAALRRVCELAPHHLSARYLLDAAENNQPKRLTAMTSLDETFLAAQQFLPFVFGGYSAAEYQIQKDAYKRVRKRLAALDRVVHGKCKPLTTELFQFITTMQEIDMATADAQNKATSTGMKQRRERIKPISDSARKRVRDKTARMYKKLEEHGEAIQNFLEKMSYDRKLLEAILRE